jgi:chromosome segregation ATPase
MSFLIDSSLGIAAIESFIEFVRRILKRLKIGFDGRGIYVSLKEEETKGSIDERIAKIDLAKANLLEGLRAIDELKTSAETNKKEAENAIEQINRLSRDKTSLEQELEAIRTVVNSDVTAFQRVAGVLGPAEIRRERLLGFVSGIIASATASGIVALIVWMVKHYVLPRV